MRKITIELPKYRLILHFRAVKKRKSIFDEVLIPTVSDVKRKYRKGNLVSRYFRHVFEHKKINRILRTSFAFVAIISSFVPQNNVFAQETNNISVLQIENTLTTQKSIQNPLDKLKINQGFSFFHPGIDLGAEIGDPIRPMKTGYVIEAKYDTNGYGNTVLINHGLGMTTRYAHLSKINVHKGDKVDMNTIIGLVGTSGHSTGPHLHFEIRIFELPQNPLNYIAPTNSSNL